MKLSFYIVIFLSAIFIPNFCKGQANTDSLLSVLKNAKDSSRIDCLNALSAAYTFHEKRDSSFYYANTAHEEAIKLNYLNGIALSLARKARIVKHFDDDFLQSEKLARESLAWFEKTNNKNEIADAYFEMEYSLRSQSRFVEMIEFAKKRYELSVRTGNELAAIDALTSITAMYRDAGDYENCFAILEQIRQRTVKLGDPLSIQSVFFMLAELMMKIGDYPAALSNFREGLKMDTPEMEKSRKAGDWDIWIKMEFAETFSHLNQFDSAWYYFERYKPSMKEDRYYRIYLVSIGEYYFARKEYQQALDNFLQGLRFHQQLKDINEVQRTLVFIGQTYLELHQDSSAIRYANEGLAIAEQTRARQIKRDCYQILYKVYDRQNEATMANQFYRKYITVKDSVTNDIVKTQLAVINYEQKIELLDKEKQLNVQQLKQSRLQKQFLIAGLAAILLIGIILFRFISLKRKNEIHLREIAENELRLQKLEIEKTKSDLQKHTIELEMQALRAQMNPHFIFNCLNAINRFILINNTEVASDYLTKFSRLIRMVLNNSEKKLISLEEEMETLNLYLSMERLRFKDSFSYTIKCDNDIEAASIFIPPLLLQPFTENAIWHGLMHKNGERILEIELSIKNEILHCSIIDNGIGRKKAASFSNSAQKKKSLGLQITRNRLDLLNQEFHEHSSMEIIDLVDSYGEAAGTKVNLAIRFEEGG